MKMTHYQLLYELDMRSSDPYSFPFRTISLNPTVQRSVGSVGVEALPGCLLEERAAV